jgi:Lon-like ATP-dependent protease
VIIPKSNLDDVLIEDQYRSMVEIIPVTHIEEVLEAALVPQNRDLFMDKLKRLAAEPVKKALESSSSTISSNHLAA